MRSERPGGSIDSFSAFLRTVKGVTVAEENASVAGGGGQASAPPWREMVRFLAERGAVPVPDLMKETGLGFSDFTEALQSATRNDMVRIYPGNGTELAELTSFGQKVASLE